MSPEGAEIRPLSAGEVPREEREWAHHSQKREVVPLSNERRGEGGGEGPTGSPTPKA